MTGRVGMHVRFAMAALTRRPGMVALAVVAVAIGASVAAALLHVSADVTRKLTRELSVLGPNLVLLPGPGSGGLLDETDARRRLRSAGLEGAPRLELTALAGRTAVRAVGADLPAARRLHPAWSLTPAGTGPPAGAGLIGRRLSGRIGAGVGDTVALSFPGRDHEVRVPVAAILDAGGSDDETLWMPLGAAQALAGRPGALSAVELRVAGGVGEARRAAAALERGGGVTARVRFALSRTEAGLLDRMRRLMSLVTLAALVSAGLCAFGTLTDLALERRREIALLQALGASRLAILRQFALESLAIGVVGGVAGWLIGLVFAQVIGRRVFESAIALRADVPFAVVGLAIAVAALAGLGPIRLALRVDPARTLKGD